ncbi:von Willebrand factor isoform X1 [Arapaima gigas]
MLTRADRRDLLTTLAPTAPTTTLTLLPFSTPVPEDSCDHAMDLAFVVDGSAVLTEEEFEVVKSDTMHAFDCYPVSSIGGGH